MEMIVPVVSIHVGNHAVLEESFEIHSVDDGTPRESFRNTREEWGESSIGFTLGLSIGTIDGNHGKPVQHQPHKQDGSDFVNDIRDRHQCIHLVVRSHY